MKWFTGTVQQAVDGCKQKDGLLIIFVRDENEQSQTITEALERKMEVLGGDESDSMFLLRIEHGSQDFNNLNSVYPVTGVPSLQFIDARGFQLFSVRPSNEEELLTGIQEGISTWKKERLPKPSSATTSIETTTIVRPAGESETQNQSSATETQVRDASEDDLQRRVELAQKKAAEIRARKEQEAKEAERQKEAQRRLDIKLAAEAERTRQERLAEQTRQQMEKERREDEAHRKKVLDQMKRDREARLAQTQNTGNTPTVSQSTAPKTAPQPTSSASDMTRAKIQFRYETEEGVKTFVGDFSATDPLAFAFDFAKVQTGLKTFSLAQLYPRRVFGRAEGKSTFRELDLVPNGSLIVETSRGYSGAPSAGGQAGIVQSLIGLVKTAFAFPMRLLGMFFGSLFPQQQIEGTNARAADSGDRRSANVEGLRRRRPSDDARYNGNSTQQL